MQEEDSDTGTVMYYDRGTRKWEGLAEFSFAYFMEGCPETSYIVVEGILYGVGGRYMYPCSGKLFMYNVDQNEWNLLPTMKICRHNCLLVHLDGFIYAIGGKVCSTNATSNAVECYDISKKEWTTVASVPDTLSYLSTCVYQGKILLYSQSKWQNTSQPYVVKFYCKYVIMEYNPSNNMWTTKLEEVHEIRFNQYHWNKVDEGVDRISIPVLFQHGDFIYRVRYNECDKPVVNKLKFQSLENDVTITLGDDINQESIPKYPRLGAFCVQDEVFLNVKGFIQETGLKIGQDKSQVNLNQWKGFRCRDESLCSNIVVLTFDKKKLGCDTSL